LQRFIVKKEPRNAFISKLTKAFQGQKKRKKT
jgi:hypothetical protein